jgi:hypothetical protein
MPAFNTMATAVTISDTASHVVLPDTDLMQDPKQPNCNVGLQLSTLAGSTLVGAAGWKVEISLNSHLGPAAVWADITSAFSPAIADIASGASSQYVQCAPVIARSIRVSCKASAGAGDAQVGICAQPSLPPTTASFGG